MGNWASRCPQTYLSPADGLNPKRLFDTVKYKQNFSIEHPDYFRPEGTLIFSGSQGEGKTLSAVDYVCNVLEDFPCAILVSNVDILGYPPNAYLDKVSHSEKVWKELYQQVEASRRTDYYDELRNKLSLSYRFIKDKSKISEEDFIHKHIELQPFMRSKDYHDWKALAEWEIHSLYDDSLITQQSILDGIHERVCIEYWGLDTLKYVSNGQLGVLYLIDEIHLELNSLESKNIDIEIMTEISQQRKQRKHIVGTSQRYIRMAKPLREQIHDMVICKNYFHCIQFNKYIDGDSATEKDGKLQADVKSRKIFLHSPDMYARYDTYAKMRRYNNEWQGRPRDPLMNSEVNINVGNS